MNIEDKQTHSTNQYKKVTGKSLLIILGLFLLIFLGFGVWFIARNGQIPAGFFPNLLGSKNDAEQTQSESQSDLKTESMQVIEADNELFITSDKDSYQSGETIQLTVSLETKVEPDGLQFIINYNPERIGKLEIEEINSFGSYLIAEVDHEVGEIKAVLLRSPNEEVDISSKISLLRITGTASQPGDLIFSFEAEETQLAAEAGQNILDNVVDLSVVVN